MNLYFDYILDKYMTIYLNDLLIYSSSEAENVVYLCQVLTIYTRRHCLLNIRSVNLEKTQLNSLVTLSGKAIYIYTQVKYRKSLSG